MGVTLLGFSSTALVIKNIKPVYTSHSQIIFNEKDAIFIKTQKELIKSQAVVQSVIIDLELDSDPAFNIIKKTKNRSTKFKEINPYETKLSSLSKEIIFDELDPLITHIRKNISSSHIADSYILDIEYRDHSPKNAAIILDKILENYIKNMALNNLQNSNNQNIRTIHHLKKNLDTAKYNFDKHTQKILLQEKYDLLTKPTKEYESAQKRYANSVENLHQFINKNDNIFPNPNAAKVVNSPIVRTLKLEQINLNKHLKALSNHYGANHPRIITLKAQIDVVSNQINYEIQNITDRVTSEYNRAKSNLHDLKTIDNSALLLVKKQEHEKLQALQDNLYKLQMSYDDYKNIYNNMKNNVPKAAQILTSATYPTNPSFPNSPKILMAGTLISFIASLIFALLSENFRNTFLSARQLEEYLNLPCFALIPRANKDKDKPLANYVMENPSSPTSEAVRALRLVLKLHADSKDISSKVITITSSFPGEGKTTLSSWIAQIAAKSGKRVILIDGDLRRPSVHRCFGKKNTLSLVEYLGGKNRLDEIVDTSNPFGLHVIYGRSVPNSALDLISSDKMDQLIRSLRKTYDLVIIDSPACMAVPDARALERYSDQLLYAVLWNKTSHQVVHNGISQFLKFGKPPIATVLTNINLKKHVQFGYGDSINYYDRYKEYSAA